MTKIDAYLRHQRETTDLHKEREKFGRDPYYAEEDKQRLSQLFGYVSRYAINAIKTELLYTEDCKDRGQSICNCAIRTNFNLPCRHQLPNNGPIPLSLISNRWLLNPIPLKVDVDTSETKSVDDISTLVDLSQKAKKQLYAFERLFMQAQDDQQREIMLSQLSAIVESPPLPTLASLKEPKDVKVCGRPKGAKRWPSAVELLEKKESENEARTLKKQKIEKKSSTKTSVPAIRKITLVVKKPVDEKKDSKTASTSPNTIDGITVDLQIPLKHVASIYNPQSDGNCGFRALSMAILGQEDKWPMVKLAMCNRFRENISAYQRGFAYDPEIVLNILECQSSPCPQDSWFLVPDCAQLAADTFNVPIAIYTGTGKNSQLFLPVGLPLRSTASVIILQFINDNHIICVNLKHGVFDFPWPSIN
ncbi:hypothetical protein DFQ29_000877 [Apophysomyces sp. BC1021]|nr:hypothetical protein DFQ29_000877 [Apophysomyces sp. BC1021]